MSENPGGTPNPLNPGFGITNAPKPREEVKAAGTGMLDYAETPTPSTPETPKAPEAQAPAPRPMPHRNHKIIDPMMRPASHQPQPIDTPINDGSNFDTLAMEDVSIDELVGDIPVNEPVESTQPVSTPINSYMPASQPTFEPKGSVVEPIDKKGGKKRVLIAGAIMLVMAAIICGAAAIAIVLVNNNGDKVTKAINKLLDGGIPSIVSAQGNISVVSDTDSSTSSNEMVSNYAMATSTSIDFNGAFDFATSVNKVTAKVDIDFSTGNNASIDISELQNKGGDTYFKVSGLDSILGAIAPMATTTQSPEPVTTVQSTTETITNCVGSSDTNCSVTASGDLTTTAGLLSIYSGLIDAVDDQWILVSGDFESSMESLSIFDNSSTCLINALGNLPNYGKDLISKYKANPFITYSTDKLEVVKVKNDLYKLGFDENKMAAFINSLNGSGFINELNACVGNKATNVNVSADSIKQLFNGFPTIYTEVDDNYNFTRVYFKADTNITGGSGSITADISLSYPSKIEINEPTEYVDMSTLLQNVMTTVFTSGSQGQ